MMWNYPYGYYNPGWFLQPFLSILLTILVIFIIFRILGGHRRRELIEKIKDTKFMQETPLDILKRRYAKGEIDKKEFEEISKSL